jgi:hypothetical protein
MKLHLLPFAALFVAACSSNSSITYTEDNLVPEYTADVTVLAHDDMEGREVGTTGEVKAAKYIAQRMKENGLSPKGDNGTFFQIFTRKKTGNPHGDDETFDSDSLAEGEI